MKKYCIVGRVKPEYMDEYKKEHKELHKGPYRELLNVIKNSGVEEEAVFIYKDMIIIYFEAEDLNHAYEIQGKAEIAKKWNALMAPMFASDYEFNESDSLPVLEKVFDLNEQLKGYLDG